MIYGNEIALRRRFVKDYNLPINIVDSPYFEYYMRTYDWFPKKEYENLVKDIDERFDGNINAWLEEYAQIRDKIITFVENSNSYKKFNSLSCLHHHNRYYSLNGINNNHLYKGQICNLIIN